MAVLARAAALAALAGCYSPDLRDCTVSCASSADCAGAQVCGSDHFCAQPAAAGTCTRTAPDAAVPATDAAPPDAPATAMLELVVTGHGQLVAGSHLCMTDCTYELPLVPIDVVAVGAGDQTFDKWTLGPCVGSQSTTCTVTPPATVGVKFHKADH